MTPRQQAEQFFGTAVAESPRPLPPPKQQGVRTAEINQRRASQEHINRRGYSAWVVYPPAERIAVNGCSRHCGGTAVGGCLRFTRNGGACPGLVPTFSDLVPPVCHSIYDEHPLVVRDEQVRDGYSDRERDLAAAMAEDVI
ncbi:MAG TPA: hypothetical protein VLL76_10155 [Candidatus Omnitrophota bacterium]|nr:hypothetical protein [Candidatus Omnitrophota bacterium]